MASPQLAEINADSKQVASYAGVRSDVLPHVLGSSKVLDVGCNVGSLARAARDNDASVQFWGLDINADVVEKAREVMVDAQALDLDDEEALEGFLDGLSFDTIVAADVLEHTVNPWKIAQQLLEHLEPGGKMVVSLPNLGRWDSILQFLIHQKFPRRDRGVFDNTHLRFFLFNNLEEFASDRFEVTLHQRNIRFFEGGYTYWLDRTFCRVIRYVPWLREFFVFQWVFLIHHR